MVRRHTRGTTGHVRRVAVAAPRVTVAQATATDRRARLGQLAHVLAGVVSALLVLFVVGFVLSNPTDIVYGVAPVILLVLTLGLLGAMLTVGW